jgi:hypothetical protein
VVEAKENPTKDQGDHQEKKKKKEGKKAPTNTIREKSAIKKTKVHKAFKISTPADSEDASGSKDNPKKEEGPVVEKDQITSAEKEEGGAQNDNTIPTKGDAPNCEKKGDPPTKRGNLTSLSSIYHFFKLLNVSLKSFL